MAPDTVQVADILAIIGVPVGVLLQEIGLNVCLDI
jgi:hypothetical protein